MKRVTVRVYGPLNDFIPPARRHAAWSHVFTGRTSVKDLIEGLGIPHPEVDLLLVNGTSVSFRSAVEDGDRIAVYPRFEALDVAAVTRVRPTPPARLRFVLDVHLGTLARYLRLAGLDAVYRPDATDDQLADIATRDHRVLLTRDRGMLKHRAVMHGYCVRATAPERQLVEVLGRFGPVALAPFSRCLRCNETVHAIAKTEVEARLPRRVRAAFEEFWTCAGCRRSTGAGRTGRG